MSNVLQTSEFIQNEINSISWMQRHLFEFFLTISFISRRKHISYTIVSFVSHAYCLTMMLMVAPLKSIIDNRHVVRLGPFHSIIRREHFIHKVHYKTTFGDHLSAQRIVINWIFHRLKRFRFLRNEWYFFWSYSGMCFTFGEELHLNCILHLLQFVVIIWP